MSLRLSIPAIVAAFLFLFTSHGFSQAPLIKSFDQDGVLVCTNLAPGSMATVEWCSISSQWQELKSVPVQSDGTIEVSVPMSYAVLTLFRVRGTNPASSGIALIPAGSFIMGDSLDGISQELPLHSVYVSAFYMDRYEVTKALWDEVYSWAIMHNYAFDHAAQGEATNHPAHTMNWYDVVKWCNARSEKEGKTPAYYTDAGFSALYRSGQVVPFVNWNSGYRLPTEAEWEKAARGGFAGRRFPWADTDNITHGRANYLSHEGYEYDTSPTRGYHPSFDNGAGRYPNPVGYFAPNGYGLYDMAGNVWEWCWDWHGNYTSASQTNPQGPASGTSRTLRGGSWHTYAVGCRAAGRGYGHPGYGNYFGGFRSVLPAGQP